MSRDDRATRDTEAQSAGDGPEPYIEHGGEVRRGFDCGHLDSWQHVLGTLRYRHANIEMPDPVNPEPPLTERCS